MTYGLSHQLSGERAKDIVAAGGGGVARDFRAMADRAGAGQENATALAEAVGTVDDAHAERAPVGLVAGDRPAVEGDG